MIIYYSILLDKVFDGEKMVVGLVKVMGLICSELGLWFSIYKILELIFECDNLV